MNPNVWLQTDSGMGWSEPRETAEQTCAEYIAGFGGSIAIHEGWCPIAQGVDTQAALAAGVSPETVARLAVTTHRPICSCPSRVVRAVRT